MRTMQVDYLAFSGHKMYAPFGAGALVGRRDWLDVASPYLAGGGAVASVSESVGCASSVIAADGVSVMYTSAVGVVPVFASGGNDGTAIGGIRLVSSATVTAAAAVFG